MEAWPGPLMVHLNAFVIELFTTGSSPGGLPLSFHASGILKNLGRFARIPPDTQDFLPALLRIASTNHTRSVAFVVWREVFLLRTNEQPKLCFRFSQNITGSCEKRRSSSQSSVRLIFTEQLHWMNKPLQKHQTLLRSRSLTERAVLSVHAQSRFWDERRPILNKMRNERTVLHA